MPTRSAGRSPSPSSKRSLLSRLKAPFGPKARHVAEYYIQPDDPHRQYGPGDVITGSVVLKVIKAISVTHITVCLHGHAQVYKTQNTTGEGLKQYNASLAAGKTKKSGGYYGNGFVSLFEDEIVLCGEGRLGEGTYQFNYELMFPKKSLPSSIDFERGAISYNVTSTMTRPTTISPISSCTRTVNFQEDIDVASLAAPKPRVISLEPIHRRSKPKRTKKSAVGAEKRSSEIEGPTSESGANNRVTDANGSQADSEPPHSPVPSDVSFESIVSGSVGTGSAVDSGAPSTTRTGETRTTSRKAITATIELQKAGFLSGETIPIKIWVAHTKQITSLRGVIATLYRQARVDMHPALPVITGGDDDVYPRSRTGLSGLSLSSAGSTHLFRKDLDQGFAALIVNPETLTAEIKATLRVPEEAFPSIASVPGAMISFKYYVEIVLDIQGKLAGLDRMLPSSVGTMNGLNNARPTDNVYAPWGGHFMSTEEIRRDKSVISSLFEVVIGTRDSAKKSAWKHPVEEGGLQGPVDAGVGMTTDGIPSYAHSEGQYQNVGHQIHPDSAWDSQYGYSTDGPYYEEPPAVRFLLPDLQEHSEPISEKEQLRRAEARLLPSAPPEVGVESSATAAAHAPSAPVLPDEAAHTLLPSAPFQHVVVIAGPSALPQTRESSQESSAPAYDHHSAPSAPPTEDKQEIQRRNLEMDRSAPEDVPEELEAEAGALALAPSLIHEPTAPVLTEEDEFLLGVLASHQLPKYER
ncbi:ph response protein [Venturia nashicola]|uniref:Ph response protein n=1 Tax=Venturia nashicola TaxID=86259 RepID=A0A4Z1PEF1_9PEZI|nr:ph response protein [Venturia nashicola]TLD39067.1 ph response protein [Venturia nashicola]